MPGATRLLFIELTLVWASVLRPAAPICIYYVVPLVVLGVLVVGCESNEKQRPPLCYMVDRVC